MRYGSDLRTREIVLTFDDGPNVDTTPRLLDILAQHQLKATFFVVGHRLATAATRQVLARAYKEGHHIGNHTYTHADLRKLTAEQIRQELSKTQSFIDDCGPQDHKLMRPPYGALNPTVSKLLQELGYTVVLWNVDSLDWKLRSEAWVANAMGQIEDRQHSLVLMHDIHATTVDNVETLLKRIRELGDAVFQQYT